MVIRCIHKVVIYLATPSLLDDLLPALRVCSNDRIQPALPYV